MTLITVKTDRLEMRGFSQSHLLNGLILYHCLFKIIQGVHVQVQFISNKVPDAYASDDIGLLIKVAVSHLVGSTNFCTVASIFPRNVAYLGKIEATLLEGNQQFWR